MANFVSTTYFGDGSPVSHVLDQLTELQFKNIEIGSNHPPVEFSKLNLQKDTTYIIHNYFPAQEEDFVLNLASEDKQTRDKSISFIESTIKICRKSNIKYYTIHPGFFAEAVARYDKNKNRNFDLVFKRSLTKKDRQKVINRSIKIIKNLYRFALANRIQLLIENQGSQTSKEFVLFDSVDELKMIKRAIGEHLKFNFNLAHATLAGINLYDFSIFRYFYQNSPFFEASEIQEIYDSHLPLGPGNGRILKLLKNYKELLKKRNVILEYRNIGKDKLLKSFDFVNKIFA